MKEVNEIGETALIFTEAFLDFSREFLDLSLFLSLKYHNEIYSLSYEVTGFLPEEGRIEVKIDFG